MATSMRTDPAHWQALLEQAQEMPPMALRVNLRQGSREAYLQQLAQTQLGKTTMSAGARATSRWSMRSWTLPP